MQIFSPDSKFSQFIYSATDYMKLGLLFLIFSIPGVTAGAAAAAVMTVGMRIERKEAPVIFRPFWQAFKDNFRQGTGLTLIFMLLFGFLAMDLFVLGRMEVTTLTRILTGVILLLAMAGGSLALWAFPTLARFSLTNRQILHNAVIHMLMCFPRTLLVLAAAVGGFGRAAMVPQTLPVVTLFIPALAVWYMSRTCVRRFRRFDGSEAEAEAEAAREAERTAAGFGNLAAVQKTIELN